ncbi:hypothetical protein TELCIR_18656 [Teladorsagia circumcincta]|uniref:Uncharacterized protein n=1 Tax=Teladorsagia circumcincta TaxID=45464 RepID=A0A2G9TPJ4_TELCI|nr:hypothetical protein TELCIR_18656 [Teladorsagia circumcincta]
MIGNESTSAKWATMDGRVTVFFIVGAPKSEIEMARLIAEEETFHDVIVTDIKDSYETLILKV